MYAYACMHDIMHGSKHACIYILAKYVLVYKVPAADILYPITV